MIFDRYGNVYPRVNLHFPMVFLWFSRGFPMEFPIFPWFSHGFPMGFVGLPEGSGNPVLRAGSHGGPQVVPGRVQVGGGEPSGGTSNRFHRSPTMWGPRLIAFSWFRTTITVVYGSYNHS